MYFLFKTRKPSPCCVAVLGWLLLVMVSWDASAQTYTLDGKLEVTDGTTVGGDFKLSGAPLSDELGLRILFLDDSGNVKTLTSPVVEGLRLMLTEPQLSALECDGPMLPHPNPFWMSDTGRVFVNGAGCLARPFVGIGIDAPEVLLDVAGQTRIGTAELGTSTLSTI